MVRVESCSHTLQQFEAEAMLTIPFRHLVVNNVFHDKVYHSILENLPAPRILDSLSVGGGGNLHRAIVNVESLNSPFWNEFQRAFGSPQFAAEMLARFGERLQRSNRISVQIVQDRIGYQIGPHTDMKWKRMTVLFYMPVDHRFHEFGTSICQTMNPELIDNPAHHSWDCFTESHRVLYQPNTALAFCRGPNSFHAVREITADFPRTTITLTIYHE